MPSDVTSNVIVSQGPALTFRYGRLRLEQYFRMNVNSQISLLSVCYIQSSCGKTANCDSVSSNLSDLSYQLGRLS